MLLQIARLFFAAVLLAPITAFTQSVSVAVSTDLIVLDDRNRSGVVELVNFASTPAEYSASVLDLPDGVNAGDQFVRWSPTRAVVPGNRTAPLRVAVRPPSGLPPGEYTLRVGVQARAAALPDIPDEDTDSESQEDAPPAIGVTVPIQPVIPVTIYYRHQIEAPEIRITGHEDAPEMDDIVGVFNLEKPDSFLSYVGAVKVLHEATGQIVSQGRIHMVPGRETRDVRVPTADSDVAGTNDTYCLEIWNEFPASQSDPVNRYCGSF